MGEKWVDLWRIAGECFDIFIFGDVDISSTQSLLQLAVGLNGIYTYFRGVNMDFFYLRIEGLNNQSARKEDKDKNKDWDRRFAMHEEKNALIEYKNLTSKLDILLFYYGVICIVVFSFGLLFATVAPKEYKVKSFFVLFIFILGYVPIFLAIFVQLRGRCRYLINKQTYS